MLQNRPLAPSVASIAASVLSSRASNRFRIKLTAACAMHIAMREPFDIPEDDQFMTISDYDDSNFRYGKTRFGIERSDDVLFMKVNAMNTRTPDQKKAL